MKNIFVLAFCVVSAGCDWGNRSVGLNEEFTLKDDEVIRISGTDLQIKAGGYETDSYRSGLVCRYKLIYGGIARHVESLPGKTASVGSFTISTRNNATGLCAFIVKKVKV